LSVLSVIFYHVALLAGGVLHLVVNDHVTFCPADLFSIFIHFSKQSLDTFLEIPVSNHLVVSWAV